tara:strand:+ start:179 stop:1852 length:1674 start_codon:yes stop_codon:yes gene_type:complete
MKQSKVILIEDPKQISSNSDTLYMTFSKSCYKRLIKEYTNIDYFFSLDNIMNEEEEIDNIEKSLYKESQDKENFKWLFLSFTFIYRILIQYNAIYNRFQALIKKYPNIKTIEASSSISILFKYAIENIVKKNGLNVKYNDRPAPKFSYSHSQLIASDIPSSNTLDKTNILLYLIGKALQLTNHKIFVFDSQVKDKSLTLFRISYLKITNWIKLLIVGLFSKNNVREFYKDFMRPNLDSNQLDKKNWNFFRDDQIQIIQLIVDNFLNYYSYDYLENLSSKIETLLISSCTKKIITDDINTPLRRLVTHIARNNNILVEHLPHGLYSESDYPYIQDANYLPTKLLAWNQESSTELRSKGWNTEIIRFPLGIIKNNKEKRKNLLIMLGHGDRIDLNSFEEHILDLATLMKKYNLHATWKYHELKNQTTRIDSSSTMLLQRNRVEELIKYKIDISNPFLNSQSLMVEHKKIIFMTWTTGILYAAIHGIPFIVYKNSSATSGQNKDKPIHFFDNIKIPFAENINQIENFIVSDNLNAEYLDEIKLSLKNGLYLKEYIKKNID